MEDKYVDQLSTPATPTIILPDTACYNYCVNVIAYHHFVDSCAIIKLTPNRIDSLA